MNAQEDNSITDKLIQFRDKESKDWWDSISKDEVQSINAGITDAENQKLNSHSSAKKLYEKWL